MRRIRYLPVLLAVVAALLPALARGAAGGVPYEYWIDDADSALQTGVTAADSTEFTLPIGHLSPGLHTLFARAYTEGKRGPLMQQLFVTVGSMKLGGYEYWIDDSYARRESARNNSGTISLDVPIKDLKPGLHTLYLRCTDTEGRGGSMFQQLFVTSGYMDFGGYEYWLDEEYSSRVAVKESSPTVNFDVSLDHLKPGLHTLYMRCADSNGNAGPLFQQLFVTVGSMKLGSYEYWLDEDVASRKKVDSSEGALAFDVPIDHLRPGLHSLFIRCSDTSGGGGPLFQQLFVVTGQQDIQGIEYWFDDNYSSAVMLPPETAGKVFTIPTDGLKGGLHLLNFRTISSRGRRGTLSQSMILLDDIYHKSIAGYRYRVGDNAGYEAVTPADGAEQQAYVLPAPEWRLPALEDISASLLFEGTKVAVEAEAEVEVMLQMQTRDGRWLAPVQETVRREGPEADAAELRPFSTLALDKPAAYGLSAFYIDMAAEATYWLRGSQDADVYVAAEADPASGRWYSAAELRSGIQLDLAPGRWFGVLVNAPVNADNADASIELRLNDTPGNMTPSPIINVSESGLGARVEITCANPSAEIWYTLDGSLPEQEAATRYELPFDVERNLTVTARAYAADFEPSEPARKVIDSFKAPRPRIELQGFRIVMGTDRANDSIYYTLDGTDPRDRSRATLYAGPFDLPQQSLRVRAVTVRDGWHDSDEETLEFKADEHVVDNPRIIRQEDGRVAVQCSTEGAVIRYTLDGKEPTEASQAYTTPITLTGNMTIKAKAFKTGMYPSMTVTLTISDLTTPAPAITNEGLTVSITADRQTDTIRYTLDGSEPTAASPLYTAPLSMEEKDVTVKAIAQRADWNDSPVALYEFKAAAHKVAKPEMTIDEEGRVAVLCSTEGAVIRITTDGTDPTEASQEYTSPLIPTGNMTFKAKAFKADMFPSEVASLVVSDMMTPSPKITNEGLTVAIAADRQTDTIRYTLDGTDPTAASPLYESPLTMEEKDVTVKAIATRADWNDSPVALYEFKAAAHKVAKPEMTIDGEGRVAVQCSTEGAVIRYTTDGQDPTETSQEYTSPLTPTGNMTFKAKAFKADMFPSEVASLVVSDMMTPSPKITNEGLTVTITADRQTDTIRYTLDGTDPTAASPLYTAPLSMEEKDVTVKAIAQRADWNDSPVALYEFKAAAHKVAKPEMTIDGEGRVAVQCSTEGAVIRITTDGSDPTEASQEYTAPIVPTGNMTFKARAFKADMFPSEVDSLAISDMTVEKPKARYEAHAIVLTAADEADTILYVIDGDVTATEPSVYTVPIPVEADCTVSFFGRRAGYNDSPADEFSFSLADWKMPEPKITPDYRNGTLTITAETDVRLTIDGAAPGDAREHALTLTGEAPVEAITAMTLATDADHYDSDTVTFTPEYEPVPVLSHDGRTLSAGAAGEYEILDSDAEDIRGTFTGTLDLPRLFTVTVRRVSDSRFPSAPVDFRSMAYYDADKEEAGCREPGRLADGFAWAGADHAASLTRIALTGAPGEADFDWLRAAMPALREVDLSSLAATALPERALGGMEMLESVTMPAGLTEGTPLFGETPRLTSLILTGPLPEGIAASAGNPNLLVLTPQGAWAPADARLTAIGEGDSYAIDELTLADKAPFKTPARLTAKRASLTREFGQVTPDPLDPQPKPQGWETIALPFNVQSMTHETAGEILPFAAIEPDDTDSKPFWLFRAGSGEDWERAAEIEAGAPYLISMPQHDNYLPQFRLAGRVTFSAENVTVTPEACEGRTAPWRSGRSFVATFMPLTEDEAADALTLNVGLSDLWAESERLLPGSAFTAEDAPEPFTAYVTRLSGSESYLPVWPGTSSAPVLADDDSLIIERIPGGLRLTSAHDREVAIVTTTGLRIESLSLTAGEARTVRLAPGVYIIAGRKVAVE